MDSITIIVDKENKNMAWNSTIDSDAEILSILSKIKDQIKDRNKLKVLKPN